MEGAIPFARNNETQFENWTNTDPNLFIREVGNYVDREPLGSVAQQYLQRDTVDFDIAAQPSSPSDVASTP